MNYIIEKQMRGMFAVVLVGAISLFAVAAMPRAAAADDYGGVYADPGSGYDGTSYSSGCCDYGGVYASPDTTDYGGVYASPDTTDYGGVYASPDTTDYGGVYASPDTPTYSYTDYGTSGSTDYTYGASSGSSYGGSSYAPSYSPSYAASTPIYPATYYSTPAASRPATVVQQQQQQQQQQQSAAQPINIVNNNNNTNTNTNPVTVTTVTQAAPQPVVQYTYPVQPTYYQQPVYYNQPTYQNLYCSITASPNNVQSGQYSYLTWSSNGTSAVLTNVGSVAANGSYTVHPYGSTTYTLTIYGQGGSATCSTYVTVANIAPYVSLTQIPYTGFDFGPVGNAIYWMSLLSLAVAGSYLLIYYKGGALALATGMFRGSKSAEYEQPRPLLYAPQQPVAAVETDTDIEPETRPVVASLSKLPTMQDHSTKDTMVMARTDGVPRIVITRA